MYCIGASMEPMSITAEKASLTKYVGKELKGVLDHYIEEVHEVFIAVEVVRNDHYAIKLILEAFFEYRMDFSSFI